MDSFPTLQGAWQEAQGWASPLPRPAIRAIGQPVTGESFYYLSLLSRFFLLEFLLGGLMSSRFSRLAGHHLPTQGSEKSATEVLGRSVDTAL